DRAMSRLRRGPVDGARAVLLPRTQDRRGERRLVGGIGEVLRFHGEAVAVPVDDGVLAPQRAVEKVAGIELQSWLRSGDLHHTPGCRLVHACRERRLAALAALVQHEVVVVAAPEAELRIVLVDAGADRRRRAEVERRARDAAD